MAIGTLAAIGIGLSAIGGVASAASNRRAATTAANTAQNTTNANNALARDLYGQNQQALSPFMQRGNVAGDYLNAMLGLPSGGATGVPGGVTTPPAAGGFGGFGGIGGLGPLGGYGGSTGSNPNPRGGGLGYYGNPAAGTTPPGTNGPMARPGVTQQNAQDAFGNYIQNSDYGFRFATGANNVNSGYAGAGSVKSGAAMKSLEDYRQNLQSGYRGEYMNALGNQQGVGLSGANALAGVSSNFGNSIMANNNSAGTAAANAALVRGSNGVGNVLSMVGGGLFGYGRS